MLPLSALIITGLLFSIVSYTSYKKKIAYRMKGMLNQPAPLFTLLDQHHQPQSLLKFRGKWVILCFYPKSYAPYCTQQVCLIRDSYKKIEDISAIVIAINTEDTKKHMSFTQHYHLPFLLLSDTTSEVSQAYYSCFSWINISLTNRTTYIIDDQGVIRHSWQGRWQRKSIKEILTFITIEQQKSI